MTYISHATIKNYKSLRDTSIDFSAGLNVIIGKNGGGKTNFLNAVKDLMRTSIEEENSVLSLEILYNTSVLKIKAEMKTDSNKKNGNSDGKYLYTYDSDEKIDKNSFENEHDYNSYLDFINDGMAFIHYGIPFDKIETLKITENSNLKIEPNYPIFNKIIQNNWAEKSDNIQDFVKEILVFPNELCEYLNTYSPIQAARFNQMRVIDYVEHNKKVYDNIQIQFQVNNEWLYWQQLSDGTRRLFYLITEIYWAKGIIFIEEPELGIHPHQLHELMRFITAQAKTKQIIVTTHSPQVLNHLTSEELHKIIICEITEDGTKMRHLTEKQTRKAKNYMKSELSLGDYWVHADLEPSNDDVI